MERKKEATRILLEEGLKELMKRNSFEKITVKMITDEAGVLRPTFYNYFQDKYELLEGIFCEDIEKQMRELIQDNMEEEAVKILFFRMEKERSFYRKAFEITGQNSFEEILKTRLYELFLEYLTKNPLKKQPGVRIWKKEIIARYYSVSMTGIIREWLQTGGQEIAAEDILAGYHILMTHAIFDLIEKKEKS